MKNNKLATYLEVLEAFKAAEREAWVLKKVLESLEGGLAPGATAAGAKKPSPEAVERWRRVARGERAS